MMTTLTFIAAPIVTMREHATKFAEVVSQAYFSEKVNVLEENSDWVKIETVADHYQGWIQKGNLCEKKALLAATMGTMAKVHRVHGVHLYHVKDTIYGPLSTLPFDSRLDILDDADTRWIKVVFNEKEVFIQRGDVSFKLENLSLDQLPEFSQQFLGLPYTWGGRSSFGYDCSGFVQMLYRQLGIALPRDSNDQAKWEGFKTIAIDELSPGDLLYFGLDEGRIRHAGMYIGSDQFIHATHLENAPYIHISKVSDPEWTGSGKYPYRTARSLIKDWSTML